LRLILWILSAPYIFISFLLNIFRWNGIHNDLEKCLNAAGSQRETIPQVFIDALIVCEDRRNPMHPGIDPISIVRAIYVFTISRKIQGASTIEQQFVRVVLNRYERTIARKFREQIVAMLLASRINKNKISSSYLSLAFYGSASIGINGLKSKFGNELENVSFEDALKMVAQLKYPRPLSTNEEWQGKIDKRINYLLINTRKKSSKLSLSTPQVSVSEL